MIARKFRHLENRTFTFEKAQKKRGSELICLNEHTSGPYQFCSLLRGCHMHGGTHFLSSHLTKGPPAVRSCAEKEALGLVSMDTLDALAELAEAEYRVPEINAQIDAQRRLIEALAFEGHDITSAQLVLDSLLMSLFLCIEERQRLRSILNTKDAEAHAA